MSVSSSPASATLPTSSEPAAKEPRQRRRLPWRRALLLLLILWDFTRPPAVQWSTRATLTAIDIYQATLSKRLPAMGAKCRFEPSCSHYGEAVIARDGIPLGAVRAAWRILRCGPWTPAGTLDPPLPAPPTPPEAAAVTLESSPSR